MSRRWQLDISVLLVSKAKTACNQVLRQGFILFFRGQLVTGLMHPLLRRNSSDKKLGPSEKATDSYVLDTRWWLRFTNARHRSTGYLADHLAGPHSLCRFPYYLLTFKTLCRTLSFLFTQYVKPHSCRCYLPHYVKSHSCRCYVPQYD